MPPHVLKHPILVLAATCATALSAEPPPASALLCLTCHGADAQGNRELGAPPLAGLPAWYLEGQIESFRKGFRGAATNDLHAYQMRAVALAIDTNALPDIVAYLEKQTPVPPPAPEVGDVDQGRWIYTERCMGCHFFHGWGDPTFKSAPIATFPAWYQQKQMEAFRSGARGSKPIDEPGWKMRTGGGFTEDRDLQHIWAFLAELGKRPKPGNR